MEHIPTKTITRQTTSFFLVLSYDETQNVITFYYKDFKTTKFTINYLDMAGEAIPGKPSVEVYLRVGDTYTVNTANLTGWVYDHTGPATGARQRNTWSAKAANLPSTSIIRKC